MEPVGIQRRDEPSGRPMPVRELGAVVRPVLAGLAVLLLLIGLIGYAIHDPRPHGIPVGLVGPAAAVGQLQHGVQTTAPGAFTFTTYASEDSARSALDSRSVVAILVFGPAPRLVIAGAAGDTTTGVVTGAFSAAFKAQGQSLAVETVHPFAAGDPHGLILFFLVLAITIAAVATQAMVSVTGREGALVERFAVLVAFAALGSVAAIAGAALIVGGYGSSFWPLTGLVALASAGTGAAAGGAARLLGSAGLALAVLILVPINLVSSGGPLGSELLPDAYRALAPWMPAGQLYSGLRGVLYFDGAATAAPVLVLAGWLLAGLILLTAGELISRLRVRAS